MIYIIIQNAEKLFASSFLRDINGEYLSLKDTDDEEIKFADQLNNIDRGIKSIQKKLFLCNIGSFFTTKEIVLNSFETWRKKCLSFNKNIC